MSTAALPQVLKQLGDPTRLRLLALVEERELSVGELCRALSMAQPRVSNQLRLLREGGWIAERRAGTNVFVRLAPDRGGPVNGEVWETIRPQLAALPAHRKDRQRLESLLERRERRAARLFDHLAADWDKIGVDFATGQARQRAAACLLPRHLVIADIGCGTGYLARGLAGLVQRVICIDRSKAMLSQAKKRLARELPEAQVEFRRGELDALPLEDRELDGLVAGMVLHHLPKLADACAEMRRVLKPGAPLAILELEPHAQEWMREQMGDLHLGLAPEDVAAALRRAGFEDARIEPVDDHYTLRPRGPNEADTRSSDTRSSDEGNDLVRLPLYLVRAFAPGRP